MNYRVLIYQSKKILSISPLPFDPLILNIKRHNSLTDCNQKWFTLSANLPQKRIPIFQNELLHKYKNMQFESFDELYNYLAINLKHELVSYDYCLNKYFLTYENHQYKWTKLDNI